jgi:hypothetical protein
MRFGISEVLSRYPSGVIGDHDGARGEGNDEVGGVRTLCMHMFAIFGFHVRHVRVECGCPMMFVAVCVVY